MYQVTNEDGSVTDKNEILEYEWFCTGGSLGNTGLTGRGPGRGAGSEPLTASEDTDTVFTLPEVETTTDLILYVVIRDDRYGSSWLEYPVQVTP